MPHERAALVDRRQTGWMPSERAQDRHGDVTANAIPAQSLVHGAACDAGFNGKLLRGHLASQQRVVQADWIESSRANVVERLAEIFRDERERGAGCRGWDRHVLHMMHNGIVDVYLCERL